MEHKSLGQIGYEAFAKAYWSSRGFEGAPWEGVSEETRQNWEAAAAAIAAAVRDAAGSDVKVIELSKN